MFVNASRGAVVETGVLKSAMESQRLGAVVLDVWEGEPDIDAELLQMVDIGTPHIAGYSLDGKIAGMIMIYNAVCEHFSIQPGFGIEDFLPEPAVPELALGPGTENDHQALLDAVRKVYSIARDDAALRATLDRPAEERPKAFDDLRKDYPVRREFQNTTVVVGNSSDSLARKLVGIGFRVVGKE